MSMPQENSRNTVGKRLTVIGITLTMRGTWLLIGQESAEWTTAFLKRVNCSLAGVTTTMKRSGIIIMKTALPKRAGIRGQTEAGTGFPQRGKWLLPAIKT